MWTIFWRGSRTRFFDRTSDASGEILSKLSHDRSCGRDERLLDARVKSIGAVGERGAAESGRQEPLGYTEDVRERLALARTEFALAS